MRKIVDIAAFFAFAAAPLIFGVATSSAQYPPPGGSITLLTSATVADAGKDVTVTGLVRDDSGQPAAGATCAFSIASQPGDDASVSPTGTTNAQGIATASLETGSATGTVVVSIVCGELASTALVSVVAGVQSITPPATGDAGLAGS